MKGCDLGGLELRTLLGVLMFAILYTGSDNKQAGAKPNEEQMVFDILYINILDKWYKNDKKREVYTQSWNEYMKLFFAEASYDQGFRETALTVPHVVQHAYPTLTKERVPYHIPHLYSGRLYLSGQEEDQYQ